MLKYVTASSDNMLKKNQTTLADLDDIMRKDDFYRIQEMYAHDGRLEFLKHIINPMPNELFSDIRIVDKAKVINGQEPGRLYFIYKKLASSHRYLKQ